MAGKVGSRQGSWKKACKKHKLLAIENSMLRETMREQENAIKQMRTAQLETISESLKAMVEAEQRRVPDHTPHREWRTAEEVEAALRAEQERVSSKVEIVVIRRAK